MKWVLGLVTASIFGGAVGLGIVADAADLARFLFLIGLSAFALLVLVAVVSAIVRARR